MPAPGIRAEDPVPCSAQCFSHKWAAVDEAAAIEWQMLTPMTEIGWSWGCGADVLFTFTGLISSATGIAQCLCCYSG